MRGLTAWSNETSWRHEGAATPSLLNQQPAAAKVLAAMLDRLHLNYSGPVRSDHSCASPSTANYPPRAEPTIASSLSKAEDVVHALRCRCSTCSPSIGTSLSKSSHSEARVGQEIG